MEALNVNIISEYKVLFYICKKYLNEIKKLKIIYPVHSSQNFNQINSRTFSGSLTNGDMGDFQGYAAE